jgi:hypothetical protein
MRGASALRSARLLIGRPWTRGAEPLDAGDRVHVPVEGGNGRRPDLERPGSEIGIRELQPWVSAGETSLTLITEAA